MFLWSGLPTYIGVGLRIIDAHICTHLKSDGKMIFCGDQIRVIHTFVEFVEFVEFVIKTARKQRIAIRRRINRSEQLQRIQKEKKDSRSISGNLYFTYAE